MRLLEILNSPWALSESRLREIQDLYVSHTRREKIDLKAWEAASGQPAGATPVPYQVTDGVAVLDVAGVLTKAPSAWNRICGLSSTQTIQQDLQTALNDPTVKSILLRVESPGGMVDGTQELAAAVFAARDKKPVAALIDGLGCSAAYWVAAAASAIYITSDTTQVGSIGVVATHTDVSKAEENWGQKTTEITAGKYKRISSSYAPLSEEGRATIQGQVDHIYSVFVNEVAQFRGVSVDTVLADMADGRVFLGRQAIDAGLVDGVSTFQGLIGLLSQGLIAPKPGPGAVQQEQSSPSITESQEDLMKINRDQLSADAPELLTTILAEGAVAERSRIQGCLDAALPGHETLAKSLAFDGKTTPGEAALAINAAERGLLAKAKTDQADSAPPPVKGAVDGADAEAGADLDARNKAEQDGQPETARAFAHRITAHITAAAAQGRRLSADQAAAELQQKGKE
jgi:signal peptide peptidase SppA